MDAWGLAVVFLVALGSVLLLLSLSGRKRWTIGRSLSVVTASVLLTAAALTLFLGPRPAMAPPGYKAVKLRGELTSKMKEMMTPETFQGITAEQYAFMTEMAALLGDGIYDPREVLANMNATTPLGKEALDVTLPEVRSGKPVRLAEVTPGRPLVLILGSWGCTIFCSQFDRIVALEQEYRGQVDFVFVEVLTAPHPLPESIRSAFAAAGIEQEKPENRQARAVLAAEIMKSPFRQVLDTDQCEVCSQYKAFPERLVIINNGYVVHDGGHGIMNTPPGWKLDEVRSCLDRLLTVKGMPRPGKWEKGRHGPGDQANSPPNVNR